MANALIADLPAASSVAAGDLFELQQGASSAKGTAAQIKTFVLTGQREVLSANRTYYVATTGSNSNNGLSAGSPFLTIQKAVDVCSTLDFAGYRVTIQVADGTYVAATTTIGVMVGQTDESKLFIQGNTTTPANCVVSASGASSACFVVNAGGFATIRGFSMSSSGSNSSCIKCVGGVVSLGAGLIFGSVGKWALWIRAGGTLKSSFDYTISSSQTYHIYLEAGSTGQQSGQTVTLSGSPVWGTAFIGVDTAASFITDSVIYSGASTGSRYEAQANGVIQTFGSGASYFPGNSAGTTAGGGQYL